MLQQQTASNQRILIHRTKLGLLRLTLVDDFLTKIEYGDNGGQQLIAKHGDSFAKLVIAQIEAYCLNPQQLFAIPLKLQGTKFQQQVWQHLTTIAVGTTQSYGQVAALLNTSARAVGNACRANPIPIIIPCHRVVAKAGWGGYAGKTSGTNMDIKKRLLHHEGCCMQ